ncbi:MAG TPA: hypothetical protein VIF40_01055 [Methylosinus sp.]|jgi:hypothetical protein|uniref:hypothetical protein n=1 Tax=Methylosinus sp. TaxID=427 RepID=UPI002F9514DF
MPIFKGSTIDWYMASGIVRNHPCEVRIDVSSVVVSFRYENINYVCSGHEIAKGHFELKDPDRKAKATLHMKPDDDVLEGWWLEGGYDCMWRITLDE